MSSLGREIQNYLEALGLDQSKHMRIARYTRYWVRSIKRMCADNVELADFFLWHINAAYIVNEEKYKKKEYRSKPYVVGILYVDDSAVRSELVNRAEVIRCEMIRHEASLQEVRILSSKRGMKDRHPLAKYATNHPDHDSLYDHEAPEERDFVYEANKEYELHKARQALIMSLGDYAQAFLEHVSAMDLPLCQMDRSHLERRLPNYYWLNIYTKDVAECEAIAARFKSSVIANAETLGLNIRDIKVYKAAGEQHR